MPYCGRCVSGDMKDAPGLNILNLVLPLVFLCGSLSLGVGVNRDVVSLTARSRMVNKREQ